MSETMKDAQHERAIDYLTETIQRMWLTMPDAKATIHPRLIAEACYDMLRAGTKGPVTQSWVHGLTYMQQSVLLTGIRGPDGIEKYHACKRLIRWYRRCILLSAMDGQVLSNPWDERGGSFTGPSLDPVDDTEETAWGLMESVVSWYIQSLDLLPHHYQLHFLHGAEIIGYKHPDVKIRQWWRDLYFRLVRDMHLLPETEEAMDERLGDNRAGWEKHADEATRD